MNKPMREERQRQVIDRMAFKRGGLVVATCLALALICIHMSLVVECQEQLTVESRQQKDNRDLTATIEYLEKLDNYFSQLARPR